MHGAFLFCLVYIAKTKALISCAVNRAVVIAQLFCAFVFAHAKIESFYFAAHFTQWFTLFVKLVFFYFAAHFTKVYTICETGFYSRCAS